MSKLTPSVREVLVSLKEAGDVVQIERRIRDADVSRGVVVGVGPDWVLVQAVDWDTILNGYSAVRIDDVLDITVVDDGGPESFPVRALRYFKQTPRFPEGVDLSTLQNLLSSAANVFHLVTIHTEWIDAAVCNIGQPTGSISDRLTLREITPQAIWEVSDQPRSWDLKAITQVEFGGRYEEALFALSSTYNAS